MDEQAEPKNRIEVSNGDLGKPAGSDEEQDWSFLIPFAVPVVIVLLVIGVFAFFKEKSGDTPDLDLSAADGSSQVAATRDAKLAPLGPKVPPSPKPSPSPSPTPSPGELSPSPSPSPSLSSSPSPSAEASSSPSP